MAQNPPIYEQPVHDDLSGVLSIRRASSEPQITRESLGSKVGRITLALIIPGPYAAYQGVTGPWNLTTFTYLWHFIVGAPLDREAIQPAMFVWAALNFLIWLLLYVVTKSGFLAFMFAYFLLNLILLIGVLIKVKVFDAGLVTRQRTDYQEF